jgi:tetratricopeptide (TPR) repeat protein
VFDVPIPPANTPPVQPTDAEGFAWTEVASAAPSLAVLDYVGRYHEAAIAFEAAGRANDAALAKLLSQACSFTLSLDARPPRYVAFLRTETERSAAPEDWTPEQVAQLAALWPQATDPALRARLADLSWELGRTAPRDVAGARAAVDAYLELAEGVGNDAHDWPRYLRHLERALQLAGSLGRRNNESRERVLSAVEHYILGRAATEDGFLVRDLVRMAIRRGMPRASYYDVLVGVARRAEAAEAWDRARQYWDLAADCAPDDEARRAAGFALAEAFVQEAASVAARPHVGRLMAASFVERAIRVLREIGHAAERVDALRLVLVEYQRGSLDSLLPIRASADFTEFVARAEASVSGKPLAEALFILGTLATPLNATRLGELADERAERYLGLSLMPPVYHGDYGQVISRPGSVTSTDPQERAEARRALCVQQGAMEIQALGQMLIEPARQLLLLEHPVREDDLRELISHSPFVRGRDGLWAQGLHAGLVGEMPTAVHLLIPQIEHTIRSVLQGAGVQVSGLDADGVQMLIGLGTLLFEPRCQEIFGVDLTFTLQVLLTEQVGLNLRNRMAHGLLREADCYGAGAVYLWGLALRLACLHLQDRNGDAPRLAQD